MRIHKEGHIYCIIASLLYAAVIWLCLHFLPVFLAYPLIFILGLIWFWVFWFFRIPTRTFTTGNDLVISPCDGKVVVIEETNEGEYFKDKRLQVSIFMSPINVHVTRYATSGKVKYSKYHPGKYLVAWHPKSSTENERTTTVLQASNGVEVLFRQIAGALAKRIVWYVEEGQQVAQGAEMGFIKFGSRVDVFLPLDAEIKVNLEEKTTGGITVLAHLK